MSIPRLFSFAILLVPFASVVACADGDDGTTGDDQNIKVGTPKPGEENGMCGGIAGFRCKDGLSCKLSGNHPDASGKCEKPKPGDEGGMCGGIAGLRCNSGLSCKLAATHPDASGTCEKIACPSAGTINCQPIVSPELIATCGANRRFIQDNCPDVSFLD
jgi:hypothetical protein